MNEENYYSSKRQEIIEFLPAHVNRHLDVGCGAGRFGEQLLKQARAKEVWGVEPTAIACAVAEQHLTRVIHGCFNDDIALPDGYFDTITFNDSLEHMSDEMLALRLAWRKMRPGGTLLCSLPNVRYLENIKELLIDADWRYVDAGILDRTHLRFFTKKSMQRAISDSGFLIQQVIGINSHWWSGWKIGILRLLFRVNIEDMRWKQFVVLAKKPN